MVTISASVANFPLMKNISHKRIFAYKFACEEKFKVLVPSLSNSSSTLAFISLPHLEIRLCS